MSVLEAKKAAARKAAEWVESGMVVGIGSGTTSACFVEVLAEKCKEGVVIQGVASSKKMQNMAEELGIPLIHMNSASRIDLTVDGADEIDPLKRMIKGGGGAHVREKILANSSHEMVVIVDDRKLVPALGTAKLPVEVVFYGAPATRLKLEEKGYSGKWRINEDGSFYLTENGNVIFDIHYESPPTSPEEEDQKIKMTPGVVETGFFFGIAGRVIVGYQDGRVEIRD